MEELVTKFHSVIKTISSEVQPNALKYKVKKNIGKKTTGYLKVASMYEHLKKAKVLDIEIKNESNIDLGKIEVITNSTFNQEFIHIYAIYKEINTDMLRAFLNEMYIKDALTGYILFPEKYKNILNIINGSSVSCKEGMQRIMSNIVFYAGDKMEDYESYKSETEAAANNLKRKSEIKLFKTWMFLPYKLATKKSPDTECKNIIVLFIPTMILPQEQIQEQQLISDSPSNSICTNPPEQILEQQFTSDSSSRSFNINPPEQILEQQVETKTQQKLPVIQLVPLRLKAQQPQLMPTLELPQLMPILELPQQAQQPQQPPLKKRRIDNDTMLPEILPQPRSERIHNLDKESEDALYEITD